jgi:hypothetical protein
MSAREVRAERSAARRLAVSVVGLVATVLFVGGCSSSTSGSGGGGGGFPGASSAPGSVSGAPSGGSNGGDFCSEWLSGSPITGLSKGQIGANFVAHWDRLAALAPPEIKSDVQAIDDYLHSALGHMPDPSKAAGLAGSIGNVVKYVAQNCR